MARLAFASADLVIYAVHRNHLSIGVRVSGGKPLALEDLETLERNEDGIATAIAILQQRFGEKLNNPDKFAKDDGGYRNRKSDQYRYHPNRQLPILIKARQIWLNPVV